MFIHEKAIVESVNVGEGTRIWAFAHVMKGAKIGKNCNIGECVFIEDGVILGNNVTIKNGVCIPTGVEISDYVFVGPNAVFTNDRFPRNMNKLSIDQYKKTFLAKGCSIGGNAALIAPICIGKGALVGAGSVATKDVDDFELIYGNPSKLHGYICFCGKRFIDKASFYIHHDECKLCEERKTDDWPEAFV